MKKIIILLIIIFSLTGCTLDPYENSIYGENVIDSWFGLETDDLGKTRMEIENIHQIESRSCKYLEKNKNIYIFTCDIKYKEIGETIIPLSKSKTLSLYAVFILNNDGTYNYKVYNSSYEKGIWLNDEELNYEGGDNE